MSRDEANTDHQQLRQYLLGQLPEEQATQLDARLFAGDAARQELEDEQDSLIEDSVYKRLTENEAQAFEAQCALSPRLREKVASLRTLLFALERQRDPAPAPLFNFKQLLTVLSPALAIMLCFVAFLYVRGRQRNTALISQAVPPVVVSRNATPPTVTGIPATAFLSANVVRGSSSVPPIKIPPPGTALELQIEVRSPSPTSVDWDVALLRGKNVLQSSTAVPLHQLGSVTYLSLTIAAASLHPGAYSVRYSPHADPGKTQYRQFQVN